MLLPVLLLCSWPVRVVGASKLFPSAAPHFRVLKRTQHPFQSAGTHRASISECGNALSIHFRVRERTQHPFQSAGTHRASISEYGNASTIYFRVRRFWSCFFLSTVGCNCTCPSCFVSADVLLLFKDFAFHIFPASSCRLHFCLAVCFGAHLLPSEGWLCRRFALLRFCFPYCCSFAAACGNRAS